MLLRGPVLRLRVKGAEYHSFALCLGVASLWQTRPEARCGPPAAILPSALACAQCRPSLEQEFAQSSFGIDVRFTGPPPALITLGGDRVARRPYRFRRNLEETSQAQLTNIPNRRSKRLQAQTRPQSSLGAIHAGIGVRGESLRGCPWRWL